MLVALGAASAAANAATVQSAASAKPKHSKPKASLSLAPLGAAPLIAPRRADRRPWANRQSVAEPAVAGLLAPPRYRIGSEDAADSGRRATLRVSFGNTQLYATGGKLGHRQRAGVTESAARGGERSADVRRLESGRLIAGGVERAIGPVEVGARVQYSTIKAADLDPTGAGSMTGLDFDRKSSSKSLTATMRLRF